MTPGMLSSQIRFTVFVKGFASQRRLSVLAFGENRISRGRTQTSIKKKMERMILLLQQADTVCFVSSERYSTVTYAAT